MLMSPDHAFFITGSDDGTVKVWDSTRLERNVSHKSRVTHSQGSGVKVTSLCFVENTHCFVSTGNDGSVHVVKVDYSEVQSTTGGNVGIRYGKLKVLRDHKLPQGQFAVWSHHYKSENQSVLLLATNASQVHALDLRTMSTLYTLSNPLHHGAPTCFVTDRKHHWLLLGTTHGVLDLWDLRFKMRLRAWCFPGGAPVHRITLQTVKMSRKPKFIIAGGTAAADITIWDLEKLICVSALRTSVFKETSTNRHYTLVDLDDDLHQRSGAGSTTSHGPGMLLGRFAASIESSSAGHGGGTDRSVRALALGSDDGNDFLVSAGPDWKVRCWDLARPEASAVVSGLEMEESRPVYTALPPAAPNPETTVVQERIFRPLQQQQQGAGADSNGDSKTDL
ncbi:putative phosphoinositide 3-kinase regulatory subunit 4 protein [Neofusicoccum parvum UCRNP2]|uniref:Putative phosphoinositide 3-kinase regulatory subunit 4 protein n=1 Tax=Botryosphaeria parva (strain UCR-NP2) TaxID=1287680 RepID=R1EK92_BOTPV|nr:putative phosphoinositide 3-kinase regulatory subunit 4 protein [Neofusicoccum parvum UCRNP2]